MLEKIKFSYEEAEEQKDLFTPCHTLYKCKIVFEGRNYTFSYQCNAKHCKPNLTDCLDCLFLDASCYEESEDILAFAEEYYTDDKSKARKAYNACKRTSEALKRVFGDDIDEVLSELENAING